MDEYLVNRDPGDETEHADDGLCFNPWCDDAALPDNDLCRECLMEVQQMLAAHEPEEAA